MTAASRLAIPAAIVLLALVGVTAGAGGTPSAASHPTGETFAEPHLTPPPRSPAHAARARPPGIRAELGAQEVTVRPSAEAAWAFHPAPRRFGCEGSLADLGSAAPAAHTSRVEYVRPELREWYVEGPRGIEQGFTLAAPPACRARGLRGVVITLGSGLGAVVSADGRAARLHDASGKHVLHYSDLHVADAAGRDLPARLEALAEGLAIHFDDAGATYPVEVDPMMWGEHQELTASDGMPGDDLGDALSLSGDTALVAAAHAGVDGAAYVFVRSGATWTQQQRLSPSAIAEDNPAGLAVSLSGDTALIGASGENGSMGAAYFFVRSGTTWSETLEITSLHPSSGGSFGAAVALAGDTALVGEPNLVGGTSRAYVYVRSGTDWPIQQELGDTSLVDAGAGDLFGNSVALSGDTALIGAPYAFGDHGAAFVFVRSGTTWALQQVLTAADGAEGDAFASAIALDGDTAVLGAPNQLSGAGAVYVFTRSGATWIQQQEILAAPLIGAFGAAVAVSGGVVAVGGFSDAHVNGVVAVYAPTGGSAPPQQMLATGNAGLSDGLGISVALDGLTLLAGAPGQGSSQGAAYVFALGLPAGDPCTSAADCLTGSCVDGVCCTTAACSAASTCNDAETCQPGTGLCSHLPVHEGMACDTGLCTAVGTCQDGVCVAGPLVCPPPDACHDFGTCDPTSGKCANPTKPDGQPCPSGHCAGGVCVDGASPAGAGGGGGTGGSSAGGCSCEARGTPRGDVGGAIATAMGLLLLRRRRRLLAPEARPIVC